MDHHFLYTWYFSHKNFHGCRDIRRTPYFYQQWVINQSLLSLSYPIECCNKYISPIFLFVGARIYMRRRGNCVIGNGNLPVEQISSGARRRMWQNDWRRPRNDPDEFDAQIIGQLELKLEFRSSRRWHNHGSALSWNVRSYDLVK